MKVTVELDELAELHSTAKLSEYRQSELERVRKVNAYIEIVCERLTKENKNLRCELSTRPTTRELQSVTKTAISNAKDVLDHPGDHFHTVYNALRDLVSRLEQEGLA